jgi:hypothetical protein
MEDVLDVYHRPYDEACPLICIDEQPKQLVSETRVPVPPRPGTPSGYDYEYKREGVPTRSCCSSRCCGGGA